MAAYDRCPIGPWEPPVIDAPVGIEDAAMAFEVTCRGRCTVPCQVIRRSDENPPAGRQPPSDQPGIQERAVPDHGIISFCGQVHPPIVEIQRQLDAGMLGEKRINRRSEIHSAECDRRGDAQRADQSAAALGHFGHRFLDLTGNAGRPLAEGDPVLRQAQPARASVYKPHTKAALELNQAVADHGLRQPQPARRLADRAGLNNSDKGGDAIEFYHRPAFPEASSAFCSLIRKMPRRYLHLRGETLTTATAKTLPLQGDDRCSGSYSVLWEPPALRCRPRRRSRSQPRSG